MKAVSAKSGSLIHRTLIWITTVQRVASKTGPRKADVRNCLTMTTIAYEYITQSLAILNRMKLIELLPGARARIPDSED
jgi:hypothetical protein